MLEILALLALTKRIGNIVEQKGHKSGKYKLLAVVLWFGGEILGALIGAAMAGSSESSQCIIYIVALMGAAAGAGIAYSIANNVSPVPGLPTEAPQVEPTPNKIDLVTAEARVAAGHCPKCGNPVAPTDQNCPSCRINLAWAREHLDQLST